MILSDGTNEYLYGPGDLPVEQVALAGGATHYLHTDGLGDVRTVTDPSGQVTGAQSFTPYGVKAASTGTTTPFGYRAQYRDASTGLVWLRARFYDPATARFLSVDPAVESTRAPYAYAGNDPLDNIDPSGLWCPLGHNADGGCRGGGTYTWAVTNLDPAYMAIEGYANEWDAAQQGCSGWTVFKYGAQAVLGVGLTGTAAVGGGAAVALARTGAAAETGSAIPGLFSTYKDITTGNSIRNVATDVTTRQFGDNLRAEGWKVTTSTSGRGATIYTKDGATYAVYGQSTSTGGPSAQFIPRGATSPTLKIRLGD